MFEHLDIQKALLDSHRPLPPALVRNLHEDPVLRWTYNSNANDDDNAGRYRSINVRIAGAEYSSPDALHVPQQMERLIAWYNGTARSLLPVERCTSVGQAHIYIACLSSYQLDCSVASLIVQLPT